MRIFSNLILFLSLFVPLNNINGQILNNSENGYAYIKGVIVDFEKYGKNEDYITINCFNWLNKSPVQCYFKINDKGFFSDSIFLINRLDVVLNYNGNFKTLFVSPNDTNNIMITGNNIKINSENDLLTIYLNDIRSIHRNNPDLPNSNFNTFNAYRKKIYKDDLERNKEFLENNGASKFFNNWTNNFITLNYFNDITNYFLDKKRIEITDSILSPIITEIFDSLINNHSSYCQNSIYYILLNNLNELIYRQVVFEGSCLRSIRKRDLAINFSPETKKESNISIENINKGIFLCYMNSLAFIHNNKIRELLLINKYLQLYEKGNFYLSIDTIATQLKDSLILKNFLTQYWTINDSKKLNRKIVLSEINEGEKLLENIQNKYPGNVLCLVFWSTWCSPCYTHIMELESTKGKLNSHDVTFIYLCCQSHQNIWEEKIKQLNVDGTHYFLNNAQYAFISQKFNINGFPKTILISKGNYFTISTHNSDQIVKEITKLKG